MSDDRYVAVFVDERGNETGREPVVDWHHTMSQTLARVVNLGAGELVIARSLPGFDRLERVEHDPVVAVLGTEPGVVATPVAHPRDEDYAERLLGVQVHASGRTLALTLDPVDGSVAEEPLDQLVIGLPQQQD